MTDLDAALARIASLRAVLEEHDSGGGVARWGGDALLADIRSALEASAVPSEPRECAICGDYTSQGLEVHAVCLDGMARGRGPFLTPASAVPEPTECPVGCGLIVCDHAEVIAEHARLATTPPGPHSEETA